MPDDVRERMLAAYGITACGCYECVEKVISARPSPDNLLYPMVLCETCGNKRCPHAQSHTLACTGSNAVGQPGAVRYAPGPPRVAPERVEELLKQTRGRILDVGDVPELSVPAADLLNLLLELREARATPREYAWAADDEQRAKLTPRGPRILFDSHPHTPEEIARFPKGQRVYRTQAGPWRPALEGGERE